MKKLIQKANSDDSLRLASLFDSYRVFYNQASDPEGAFKYIQERLSSQESVIFFAQNNIGEILGFTQLYPSFSSQTMQRMWILNDLYVEEEFRSKGVASALIQSAKTYAIETKAKGLMLCTQNSNSKAQALYEKVGFKQDTDYKWYFHIFDAL